MLLRELCRTIEQRQQLLEAKIDEVMQAGMDAHPAAAEFGRDVLRDMKSEKYEVSHWSMGQNLIDLCGFRW